MTIPYERARATIQARFFLMRLVDPTQTPRVPRKFREEALMLLRHYPTYADVCLLAGHVPEWWSMPEDEKSRA